MREPVGISAVEYDGEESAGYGSCATLDEEDEDEDEEDEDGGGGGGGICCGGGAPYRNGHGGAATHLRHHPPSARRGAPPPPLPGSVAAAARRAYMSPGPPSWRSGGGAATGGVGGELTPGGRPVYSFLGNRAQPRVVTIPREALPPPTRHTHMPPWRGKPPQTKRRNNSIDTHR